MTREFYEDNKIHNEDFDTKLIVVGRGAFKPMTKFGKRLNREMRDHPKPR